MLSKNKIQAAINWILPQACVLCGDRVNTETALCQPCKAELPWLNQACTQCALPLYGIMQTAICGDCLDNPPVFKQTTALFHYQPPINKLISGLKFHNKLLYAKILSYLMLEKLAGVYEGQSWPDCIIPIPLHKRRLRERGYNQAIELARPIARAIKCPLIIDAAARINATAPQTSLSADDRQRNVKNVFQIRQNFTAEYVAVIDDVITTGSTIKEFSRVLYKAGIKRIDVWCFARAG